MDRNSSNPFVDDVFIDHPSNLPGVGCVHQHAFSRVLSTLESMVLQQHGNHVLEGSGRTFLITSPRAGYGKTHLVARLRENAGSIANFLSLPFDRSRPVTWPVALSSVLRQLSTQYRDSSGSVTAMEELSRFFLSRLVIDLLSNGVIKLKDCPETADALRADFVQLYSNDSPSKIASWTEKRSSELARNASPAFLQQLGMRENELSFWIRVMIDAAKSDSSAFDPLRGLSNGEARERLLQLLRIGVSYRPMLLIADGLDGFFGSDTAGMDIAEIVTGIREHVGRSLTLLCVNEDVWKSSFQETLPSAWLDRITGESTKLRNISPEAAGELVATRLGRVGVSGATAQKFIDRLTTENLWVDAETTLYPRSVLRQAGELWKTLPDSFFAVDEQVPAQDQEEEDLSEFTDKLDFFKSLQEEQVSERPTEPTTTENQFPTPSPPDPSRAPQTEETAAPNPFFATNGSGNESELAGIDSIISDIRGSGKAVVSEIHSPQGSPQPAPPNPDPTAAPNGADTRPPLPQNNPFTAPQQDQPNAASLNPTSPVYPKPPVESVEALIKRREEELLRSGFLKLDLERLGNFIREMGTHHPALKQHEERFPSSRSSCLRWSVRKQSILLGFESPRNVYFWNNLLQQSLSSNDSHKIVAFSHPSDKFDSSLFSTFGFSPTVIKGKMDVISMKDRELAMIYAAEATLREAYGTAGYGDTVQRALRYLDPLWRRICEKAA